MRSYSRFARPRRTRRRTHTVSSSTALTDWRSHRLASKKYSDRPVSYDPERRPHTSSLIKLYSVLSNEHDCPRSVARAMEGKSIRDFKAMLTELVIEFVAPIRLRLAKWRETPDEIDQILADGAERAREQAQETMRLVHDAIGLIRSTSVAVPSGRPMQTETVTRIAALDAAADASRSENDDDYDACRPLVNLSHDEGTGDEEGDESAASMLASGGVDEDGENDDDDDNEVEANVEECNDETLTASGSGDSVDDGGKDAGVIDSSDSACDLAGVEEAVMEDAVPDPDDGAAMGDEPPRDDRHVTGEASSSI